MSFAEIQSYISAIEQHLLQSSELTFDERLEREEFIEFQLIPEIEDDITREPGNVELTTWLQRARNLLVDLRLLDLQLFKRLRTDIGACNVSGKEFRNLIADYVDIDSSLVSDYEDSGYDNLDAFINGLIFFQETPDQVHDLGPNMVHYQKTPVRIIFDLVNKLKFTKGDVFFDIGSGLGQVGLLVNLLTGATVKGIEFQPVFCNYATACAAELNLSGVTFINEDARNSDYSKGTIFFMFTPFTGEIMLEVIEALRKESLQRKLKIITLGPCTEDMLSQNWLDVIISNDDNIYKPAIFSSR